MTDDAPRAPFPPLETIVERLDLEPHPEGGYFRETWRSSRSLSEEALNADDDQPDYPDYPGARRAGTSILFLLPRGETSSPHRIRSEELWLHQYGDPVALEYRSREGEEATTVELGSPPERHLQAAVPARARQRAEPLEGPAGYGLVACVSIPGFEFEDFELLDADDARG